jgi:hypothetical protein
LRVSPFLSALFVFTWRRPRLGGVFDVDEHGPQYDKGLGVSSVANETKLKRTTSSPKEELQGDAYSAQNCDFQLLDNCWNTYHEPSLKGMAREKWLRSKSTGTKRLQKNLLSRTEILQLQQKRLLKQNALLSRTLCCPRVLY